MGGKVYNDLPGIVMSIMTSKELLHEFNTKEQ